MPQSGPFSQILSHLLLVKPQHSVFFRVMEYLVSLMVINLVRPSSLATFRFSGLSEDLLKSSLTQDWPKDRGYTVSSNDAIICDCMNWQFRASFVLYPYVYIAPKWSLIANSVIYTYCNYGTWHRKLFCRRLCGVSTHIHAAILVCLHRKLADYMWQSRLESEYYTGSWFWGNGV